MVSLRSHRVRPTMLMLSADQELSRRSPDDAVCERERGLHTWERRSPEIALVQRSMDGVVGARPPEAECAHDRLERAREGSAVRVRTGEASHRAFDVASQLRLVDR